MNWDEEISAALPFSEVKQDALLGHILRNQQFFLDTQVTLEPSWFCHDFQVRLYKAALAFAKAFKRIPTEQELLDRPEFRELEQAEQGRIKAKLQLSFVRAAEHTLEPLKEELTAFMKKAYIQGALQKAAGSFNASKLDDAIAALTGFARTIDTVSYEKREPIADFSDLTFLANLQERKNAGLTFGARLVDQALNPYGTGGLSEGDTTLLLAPTNIGKTTTMITTAVANLMKSKDVLFITHEGSKDDIMMKFWRCVTDLNEPDLFGLLADKGAASGLRASTVMKRFAEHLVYLPLNKAGQSVYDVEAIIRRLQETRVTKMGKGFDLLVDDYPSKLTAPEQRGGQWARRQIDDLIYNRFVDLAGEYGFHCLTAIQGNRESSKAVRGTGGHTQRLLTMEDVSESFGPMASAVNVISINRNPTGNNKHVVTYHICKSRSSEVGQSIVCSSDWARSRTHYYDDPAHPNIWYPGDAPPGELIHQLLQQANINGKQVQLGDITGTSRIG